MPLDNDQPSSKRTKPRHDHLIGSMEKLADSFGVVAETIPDSENRDTVRLALSLDFENTILVWGGMGSGKSYLLGTIMEMLSRVFPNINCLHVPMASISIHFSDSEDQAPEWASMIEPNTVAKEIAPLRETYQAEPAGLVDQILVCTEDMVEQRKLEYPKHKVVPLLFAPGELPARSWFTLMGAVGDKTPYVQQIGLILKKHRKHVTTDIIRDEVKASTLSEIDKNLALLNLSVAEQFISDKTSFLDIIKPGAEIVIDLRDEYLHQQDCFAVVQVIMHLIAKAKHNGKKFKKAILVDEVHNFGNNKALWSGFEKTMRLMRHQRTSLILASQDPASIPDIINDLATILVVGKLAANRQLEYIHACNSAFLNVTIEHLRDLNPGQYYLWALRATDRSLTKKAKLIQGRPRVTQHGGASAKPSDQTEPIPLQSATVEATSR